MPHRRAPWSRATTPALTSQPGLVRPGALELYSQLKWLTLFRVSLVTVLLVATFGFGVSETVPTDDRAYQHVYTICLTTYVVSLIYMALLRWLPSGLPRLALAYVQFAGDVVTAAALVLLTGGTASAFTFFFGIVIIGAAGVLFRPGAFVFATMSAVIIVCIGLWELEILPEWPGLREYRHSFSPEIDVLIRPDSRERASRVVYGVSVNTIAFFGVGFLASSLSENVRRTAMAASQQARTLLDLQALHEHIVSSVPTGILACDLLGRITLANPTALRILGAKPDSAERGDLALFDGKVIQDVFPWLRYPIERLSEGQDVMRDESVLVTGRQRTYLGWTLSPLRDSNRERIGYTFLFQDITRVRELEHTMRRSEKMAALGELSAAIAHEVRNPLAAISGSIQMLEASQSASEKDRRLMRIVLRETEHLNRWITDFLSYARPVAVELRPVDLVALVSDVVESARADPSLVGARITFERVDPVYIRADVTRVRQVLWNLVINAQQAIARKGDGQVTLSVLTNIATTRPEVTLRVEDEGDGIAPEHLDRIFQPFFTTRERGTGLGLAVVHRIVEENDGRISVDSELGRGTTFSIVFPLAMEPAA